MQQVPTISISGSSKTSGLPFSNIKDIRWQTLIYQLTPPFRARRPDLIVGSKNRPGCEHNCGKQKEVNIEKISKPCPVAEKNMVYQC